MENSKNDDWASELRFIRRAWFKVFSVHHGVEARDFHGEVVDYMPHLDEDRSGGWDPLDEEEEA